MSRRPGSEALLERMSEMMFVDAIRRHIDGMAEQSTGWLAGLRDRFVGRALALMHDNPAGDWSIDELGRQVGLSRSALHERFVELVGLPPIQYLAQWRMQLAARMLRESQASVASIALRSGYDSEAAFGRAFKRLVGQPPAAWRRQKAQSAQALRQDGSGRRRDLQHHGLRELNLPGRHFGEGRQPVVRAGPARARTRRRCAPAA